LLNLALAATLATPPHSFPVDLLQARGWNTLYVSAFSDQGHPVKISNLSARRQSGSTHMNFHLDVMQPQEGHWKTIRDINVMRNAAPLKGNPPFPSGLPSGLEREIYPNSEDRFQIAIFGNSIFVEATMAAAFWMPYGGDAKPADLSTESKLFCERLARLTLAGFVGENLTGEGIGAVAGRATAAARSPKTMEAFAILSEWVKPTEWKVSESEDGLSIILARGQDTLTMPIGGFGMFVNGEWKPTTDTIALRDGQWWAPESALKIIAELG
jgi:hypothetical protein